MKTPALVMFSLALLGLTTSPAFAQGGNSAGGGGTVLILKDDTIVMADAYFKDKTESPDSIGERIQLGAPLIEELHRAQDIMTVQSGYANRASFTTLFAGSIFNPNTKYILVDELPKRCPYTDPDLTDTPDGSRKAKSACTVKDYTFLVKSVFPLMSIRQQALQIVHERLRSEKVSLEYGIEPILKKIYQGLAVGLARIDREMKGDFTPMTPTELVQLTDMANTIAQYEILRSSQAESGTHYYAFHRTPGLAKRHMNGGGFIVGDVPVDPSAYLGLTTLIADFSAKKNRGDFNYDGRHQNFIRKNAILSSPRKLMCVNCQIEEGAQFYGNSTSENGEIYQLRLSKDAQFIRNQLLQKSTGGFLADTRINEAGVFRIDSEEGSSVSDSIFQLSTHKGAPSYVKINVASSVDLNESRLKLDFNRKRQRTSNLIKFPLSFAIIMPIFVEMILLSPVMHTGVMQYLQEQMTWPQIITQGRMRIDLENLKGKVNCEVNGYKWARLDLNINSTNCIEKTAE